MKALLTTTILTLFLALNIAVGQDYAFRVLANKGTNSVKKNGTWEPLKTGSSIQETDAIKLGEGSYLGLLHSSGRTLELKESGEFKVSDLLSKVSTGSSSVASKYANYVMNKMTSQEGSGHRMSVTGAVERATDNSSLKVFIPESVDLYNSDAVITWENIEGEPEYTVTLKNMFDEVILEKKTSEPSIKLNFDDPKIKDEILVIFNVKLTDDESVTSDEYGIKRLSKDESQEIDNILKELKAEVGDDSSLDKLIYASFYEDNDLLIDALTNYIGAMEMSPDVPDFEDAYNQFIMRNGLGN